MCKAFIGPVLQKLTARLLNSLSGTQRAFYEREFRFFEEITDVCSSMKYVT